MFVTRALAIIREHGMILVNTDEGFEPVVDIDVMWI